MKLIFSRLPPHKEAQLRVVAKILGATVLPEWNAVVWIDTAFCEGTKIDSLTHAEVMKLLKDKFEQRMANKQARTYLRRCREGVQEIKRNPRSTKC